MKKVVLLVLCVGLAASAAQAALLSEHWETGTDGWVDYGAGPFAALDNTKNTTPGGTWSLKTADTATNYTNAKDWNFAVETGKNWYVQWEMYDTGSSREYMQVQSYAGTTLQQLVAFGTLQRHQWRKFLLRPRRSGRRQLDAYGHSADEQHVAYLPG